jgi:hypothetical protein
VTAASWTASGVIEGPLARITSAVQPESTEAQGRCHRSWLRCRPPPGRRRKLTKRIKPTTPRAGRPAESWRGAWWSEEDEAVYFNSTDGGAASAGQVWAWYRKRGKEYLELVYESPSTDVLLKPDNITVSPRGGILLCEDTDRARQTFLRGVNDDGELFDLAANVRPGTIPGSTTPASFDEFAGATFMGDWLFVNIQTPGITFAITGPWDRGPLG